MSEVIIRLLRTQALGWSQPNMIEIQEAVEQGDFSTLKQTLKKAAAELSWNGLRSDAFASLPYHCDSKYAANIRQAWAEVQKEIPYSLIFKFVDLEKASQDVAFHEAAMKSSENVFQEPCIIYASYQDGVYRVCQLH